MATQLCLCARTLRVATLVTSVSGARIVCWGAIVGALVCLSPGSLRAGTISIQFTGLNIIRSNGDLLDDDPAAALNDVRNSDPDQADPLGTVDFYDDGVLLGSLDANIFADFFLNNVPPLPVAGGAIVSGGNDNDDSFGFDLLADSTTDVDSIADNGLALNFDTLQLFYTGGESGGLAILGTATSLESQDLVFPTFSVTLNPGTISFSYSAPAIAAFNVDTDIFGFRAFGTGAITTAGTSILVPEPASVVLMGFGLLALACQARRKKRRKADRGNQKDSGVSATFVAPHVERLDIHDGANRRLKRIAGRSTRW